MLAPQNAPNEITDTLNGSLTEWYQSIDSALKASECVPGYYEYQPAPSYGTQCPIQDGGTTKIDIQCARFNVIALENSYIDVEFEVPVTIPNLKTDGNADYKDAQNNAEEYIYYVGFKSAFDLFDQYRIYSNGDLVYTQNQPYFESFINYISLTDGAKENSECYATHSKIQAMKPNVPGTYIKIDPFQDKEVTRTVPIKFKIPITQFMMLSNLKWFPGFMGTLTIEIQTTFKNLVWAKIDKNYLVSQVVGVQLESEYKNGVKQFEPNGYGEYQLNSGFAQINTDAYNGVVYDKTTTQWTVKVQTFKASTSTLKKFQLYTAFYMLKMDVYNALEYNYLQVPLLFPIQTVTNVKFTSPLGTGSRTLQNTATLSHCDTVFVIFPFTKDARTCFHNPQINFQMNINGKFYPRERISTNDDVRFYNLELDALNINNNPLISISEDVRKSIQMFNHIRSFNTTDSSVTDFWQRPDGDISSFFIGIPLSTDEDFMGGISSNGSTVQIELLLDRNSHSSNINALNWTEAPEALFLEDKIMKIYSMKPAGRKQIDITSATLEQIAAGAL